MTESTWESHTVRHFDGRTPLPNRATLRLGAGELTLEAADGAVRRWPLDRVRVMQADRSSVQLELAGEPTEAVIVSDPSFGAALRAANGGRALAGGGSGVPAIRLVLGIGIAFVVLLFAAWRWGIPALAAVAADRVPVTWERRIGAEVLAGMVKPSERVTDHVIVNPCTAVFDRLLRAQGATRDSFQLVIAHEELVNAFAAPGGYVVVTTGLLRSLRGFDELAAVMAHEITHVTDRHTTRGLFARLGVRALFSLIGGDHGGIGTAANAAGALGELSYSRRDEGQADEGGVRLLARAGIDPGAMERALESIAESAGGRGEGVEFLSTHPGTQGRRERARVLAAQNPVQGAGILPVPAEWDAMQAAIGELSESNRVPKPFRNRR